MKIGKATNMSRRRPNRSPSLPYTGAATVPATRYEITTQETRSTSPSDAAIAGSAVATIV